MKNLSDETINGLRNLGFERIIDRTLYGNSYFNVFFNEKILYNLLLVKSPLEVKDKWLATVFNRGKNEQFDLHTMKGFTIDEVGRAQFSDEKDIISFANALLRIVNDELQEKATYRNENVNSGEIRKNF